jgi:hypothetical protein
MIHHQPDGTTYCVKIEITISEQIDGMENTRSAFRILVGKPVGKYLPENLRKRWDNKIEMELKNISCDRKRCMELIQEPV